MGVLDDIKAISAFNLVEVEVEAELGKSAYSIQIPVMDSCKGLVEQNLS